MTVITTPRWATIDQVADYTGFSTRTIRQRIADGDVPAYKPHGSRIWLIDLADVDRMITEQGNESLAARIRRILAEHELPDPTDEQITLAVRQLASSGTP
jgi:excisionase family DNA binding protein